jgi:hypothetical protein
MPAKTTSSRDVVAELAYLTRALTWIHRFGRGPEWVVNAKCPVVVKEWDFFRITFGHNEGHLVDATWPTWPMNTSACRPTGAPTPERK